MYRELKKSRRCSGLTLIEVVVASALLVTVMIPILKSLRIAHTSTIKIERKTHSLILAQSKLDDIKARSIYDYTNGGDLFTETNILLDGSYLCSVTDNSGDPLKTITISVGFDSDNDSSLSSGEIEVSLMTLLARRWTD
jgi:Tfp pilus assembly protein PilV